MSAAPGSKMLDSASRLDSNAAKASGSFAQMRYSSGAATSPSNANYNNSKFKLLQPGEFGAILASGQDFFANDEWTTSRMYGGAAAAEQDAPVTLAYWRAQGLAKGATIQLNHDTSVDMAQAGAIDAYYDRTNQIWAGEYLADGLYGPQALARHLVQGGRIKHFHIPEGASFFCANGPLANAPAPAHAIWDLWAPTPSQVAFAIAWFQQQLADILPALQSVLWQDLNHWFGGAADENIVIKGDRFGSHLDCGGVAPTPPPPAPPAPAPAVRLWQGYPVPGLIAKGSGQYLGSISGPAASHGGYNASEKAIVKVLQQRLIACGFVPGQSDPNSGWADGIFDTPQDAPGTGATSLAVQRFHDAWYPNQPKPRQIWDDDWSVLFNHA